MMGMTVESFMDMVKDNRQQFLTPFDVAYKAFIDLGYDLKPADFFHKNASEFVENMRSKCWEEYVPVELDFSRDQMKYLVDSSIVSGKDPVVAVHDFIDEFMEHSYAMALSNTQSRRSRAGKEFEAILELLLIGSDISVTAQGSVGKAVFADQGLGKLVDFVIPGVVEFLNNKRLTMLISAKTTLRERWQEVPEEKERTGMREIYLATLDDKITDETRRILYESNVVLATTKRIKEKSYNEDSRMVSFEELISEAQKLVEQWGTVPYTPSEIEKMETYLKKQVQKHEKHPYASRYYQIRLDNVKSI